MTIQQLNDSIKDPVRLGPGDKIQFIKLLRSFLPLSLYEAKKFADAIWVHPEVMNSAEWRRRELVSRLQILKNYLWDKDKVLIDEVLSFISQAKL